MSNRFTTYYTAREILGYKALFNLVLSDRSDGKTFNCKVRALEDYDMKGYTTVYVRRYDTEITQYMYNTFLDEVLAKDEYNHYAQKYDFKYSKAGVQVKLKDAPKENYEYMIYFLPLSKAGKLKSQLDITNIRMIDFDEYMPLDGRYLKDEMMLLLELWKSIDRDRDQTQCILLGNRIDPFCPFFDFFGINLDIEKKRVRLYRNNTIAVQIYVNEEHRAERQSMRFTEVIKGTAYEAYDQGATMKGLNIKIAPLPETAVYMYSFVTQLGEGSIWQDTKTQCTFISNKVRKDGVIITNLNNLEVDTNQKVFNIKLTKVGNYLKHQYGTAKLVTVSNVAFRNFMPILTASV